MKLLLVKHHNMDYEVRGENGKAYFEGDDYDIAQPNIWFRTADCIKLKRRTKNELRPLCLVVTVYNR